MNKFFSVLVLGSALALSACGGDSDSSGSNNDTPDLSTNPTTPTTPTTPTNPNTSPILTPPTTPAGASSCNTSSNIVAGKSSGSCTYVTSNSNATVTCSTKGLVIDGNIGGFNSTNTTFVANSTKINGIEFKCP